MRAFVRLTCALAVGTVSFGAHAEDIPQSCMVTFNVKDKGFSAGGATMSCRLLEERRDEMSRQILATPDTGEIDGADVAEQLDALEAQFKKQQDSKDWLGLGAAITGNALATIGLGTCLETLGGGCMLAGVGKVLAMYSVIDTAGSESEKARQASAIRAEITEIRQRVVGKKSQAKALRDQMIKDATAMCMDVTASCL